MHVDYDVNGKEQAGPALFIGRTDRLVAIAAGVAATERTRTFLARTRFIYSQRAAFEGLAVELRDCVLRVGIIRHGDECETAGAAGHLVHGDIGVGHGTELLEVGAELALGGVERQISNV